MIAVGAARRYDRGASAARLLDDVQDPAARLVLADLREQSGNMVTACVLRRQPPPRPPRPSKKLRRRVETLTAAEVALFPAYVDKWVKIGLSTEPANRELFAAAIVDIYGYLKLPPPRVAWCSTPVVAVMAGAVAALVDRDAKFAALVPALLDEIEALRGQLTLMADVVAAAKAHVAQMASDDIFDDEALCDCNDALAAAVDALDARPRC